MGNGRNRVGLWVAIGLVLIGGAGILLPRALAELPGRVRQYLPSALAVATVPPLPTVGLSVQPETEIAAVLAAAVPPMAAVAATVEPLPTLSVTPVTPSATSVNEPIVVAPTATIVPTPTPAPDLPATVYLAGVPIVPQKFNNCGPTNLSMVLAYHGVAADQLAIAEVIRPAYEDRNVSPEELAAYAAAQTGLEAVVVVGGDLLLLKGLLAAGLPVIVEQGLVPEGDIGWMGHYLTLFGYDDRERTFYTRDSFLGPWEEDGRERYESVLADWQPFNNVVVIVYPSEQRPVVARLLGEALADPESMWLLAAEKARVAIQTDAGDAFAWFNLGSALTQLYQRTGDQDLLDRAVISFDQARRLTLPARMLWYQFTPYEAYLAAGRTADVRALAEATLSSQGGRNVEETYIYRALALRAEGDEAGAAADLRRAEQLNPDNPLLSRHLTLP